MVIGRFNWIHRRQDLLGLMVCLDQEDVEPAQQFFPTGGSLRLLQKDQRQVETVFPVSRRQYRGYD